jgi:hypothetical protein
MTIETTAQDFVTALSASSLEEWGLQAHPDAPVYIDEEGNAWADLPGMRIELTAGSDWWPKQIKKAFFD